MGNQEVTDPNQKASYFNQFFQSIFSTWSGKEIPPIVPTIDQNLSDITITEDEVQKAMSSLDSAKAPGPDGLPTYILKTCAASLVTNVTKLFNKSLMTSKVPNEWKRANVVPIFKKGDPSLTNNYRPVSLLPVISKILERCIYNKIIEFVRPKITSMQHGFLAGSSTFTQLLTVFSRISDILDNRAQTDVVYFDLSKAFDSVPHEPLIAKLRSFGFNGTLLNWLIDYLTNRYQRVTLDGCTSEWLPVTSGVPQGSILGPLLFLIYVNDLPACLSPETACAIFADDTKIFKQDDSCRDQEDVQKDIDRVISWGESWGLTFNKAKCTVLHITGHQDVVNYQYTINNQTLPTTEDMNDLGITVTPNFKWNLHISKITARAEKQLWMVIRALGFNAPVKAKTQTYLAMVRSVLEYGSVVWNNRFKANIQDLEKIQRKGTSFILSNPPYYSPNYINYRDRLIQLKMLPTSYRREILDLAFFLKSLHHKTSFDTSSFINFQERATGARTRNVERGIRLVRRKTQLERTAHFFHHRIVRIWNALPQELQISLKNVSEPLVIKQFLLPHYRAKLLKHFDPGDTCTWISWCGCPRCS